MTRIPITVGFVSLAMLIMVTLTNFSMQMADAKVHRVDVPPLSAEVLRPPVRYTTPGERPSMGLGTAAISAVTEALGPILPFTGGVDLRREEHWDTTQGWFHTATSMVNQVRDAFGLPPLDAGATLLDSIPRGGAQLQKPKAKPQIKRTQHAPVLSAQQPFVPVGSIASMTLSDLATAFQYALESNSDKFDEKHFNSKAHPRMRPILRSMDEAITKARGKDVLPSKKSAIGVAGDVDALQFSAAMRLFAEWRVVRQVPDGYKGFAVGMNLGQKDIVQNVAKIEKAVHEWVDYRRGILSLQGEWDEGFCPASGLSKASVNPNCQLRSPTLRDLLQYEADMSVHDRLPRLKDKTAAMGLLWVRRQLHYQTSLFANVVKVPTVFSTVTQAIGSAYSEVYDQYHGWAVQKIFKYSFQAAPEVKEIYKFMNPHRLKDVMQKASQLKSKSNVAEPLISQPELSRQERELNPLQQFGEHIAGEWTKLTTAIGNIFDDENGGKPNHRATGAGLSGQELDDFVTKEMTQDAHNHIVVYLQTVQGLLSDLARLFDELNMDDPTKV